MVLFEHLQTDEISNMVEITLIKVLVVMKVLSFRLIFIYFGKYPVMKRHEEG